jgi:hypothetical protein
MADESIIPTADAILGPTLDKFYELRPTAFQHINLGTGVYWHPFVGYRAQAAKALSRILQHVKNNRLTTAEGAALIEYVASEYSTIPESAPTTAIGEIAFSRSSTVLVGDIPKGTRFSRAANLKTQIPFTSATYETLIDVHFAAGQGTAGPIPVQAVSSGEGPNHPIRTDIAPHGVTGSGLFDPTITVSGFSAAGGSNGRKDAAFDMHVRRFAVAFANGVHGPNSAASYYGALSTPGVRHALVYDVPGVGTQKVVIADASWASSDRWAAQVQQRIYDEDLVGNGCKVIVGKIRNRVMTVNATVILRDKNYATETQDIDTAIRTAVQAYFDRPGWNAWTIDNLKSVITRCHPKILSCSSASVIDPAGQPINGIPNPNYNEEQLHIVVANGAVNTTYVGPS